MSYATDPVSSALADLNFGKSYEEVSASLKAAQLTNKQRADALSQAYSQYLAQQGTSSSADPVKSGEGEFNPDQIKKDIENQIAQKEGEEKTNKLADTIKERGPEWLMAAGMLGTATGLFDKDAPTPPSAAETYKELSESAYSPEMIRKQQEATRQATFGGTDYQYLYQDPELKKQFEGWYGVTNASAVSRGETPFADYVHEDNKEGGLFQHWVENVLDRQPHHPASMRIAHLKSSLGMEQTQRGMRLDEAKRLASEYKPTDFMSEKAEAAYEDAIKADPLAATLRTYYGNVLGDDPDYLRETGELIMSGMDPYRLRTSQGVAQAVLGTEREDRARKQLVAEGAKGLMSQQRADAIARYQLQQGTDWLSQVGLGPMTSTQVTPPDPTGAFFASFPAMQQQSALADYMQTPGLGERTTAFGKGLQTIFGNPGGQTYGLGGNTGTRQV